MLRYFSAGESHGPALSVILDGVPSGLELVASRDIDPWLRRRQGGYGRGRRMVIETDTADIQAGVRAGRSTGAPIAIRIENKDWRNWAEIMTPEPGNEPRKKSLTEARPGHVDLPGGIKYGHKDLRDVLERASARETASRVSAGAIALRILESVGIQGCARVVNFAGIPCDGGMDWEHLQTLRKAQFAVLIVWLKSALLNVLTRPSKTVTPWVVSSKPVLDMCRLVWAVTPSGTES